MRNAILVLTILSVPCFGATINVNWDGTGDYTTIQAGINAAVSGDMVIVAEGTYYENIDMKNGVTLIGSGADATTINGGGNGHVVSFSSASGTISGFTITNSGSSSTLISGITISQSTVTIENNVITNNRNGITLFSNSNCIIKGNKVIDNDTEGIEMRDSNGTIFNNVIAGNFRNGIRCFSSAPSIINNTITDSGSGLSCDPVSPQIISNNIIAHNGIGIYAHCTNDPPSPLLHISYNNVWDSSYANYWEDYGPYDIGQHVSQPFTPLPGTGEINVDPLFATGPLGDHYLSQTVAGQGANSPCVDAGSDTAENLGLDVYTTRTDKVWDVGIVDMGYHYSGNVADFDNDGSVDLEEFGVIIQIFL